MSSNLFDKCSKYANEVSNTHLVTNKDKILSELSSLKDFDDRIKLAEKHFKKLGTGSARVVFKISDDLILKIAYNDKGIAQNDIEGKLDLQTPCAANVVVADPKGKWLIMHFTENMNKEEFKKIIGVGFDAFVNCLFYTFNNESDAFPKPKDIEHIRKLPLFHCLSQMIIDGSLLIGDIDKPSSFGIKDNKVLIRDFGFNKDVFKEYYDDATSSESTPKTKTSD